MNSSKQISQIRVSFCEHKISSLLLLLFLFSPLTFANQEFHLDPSKVKGPDACGECHKDTIALWKETKHSSTFSKLPRSEKGREIADKIGIKRIKSESECLSCHFTSAMVEEKIKPVAGITCESCHGDGQDWIDVHSDFGGKEVKAENEDPAHKKERYAKSESAGMLRPGNLYAVANNCYGCHTVPKEQLVNVGGHAAGSKFELVRWSQGGVRHNVWYTKDNTEAALERRRMMFIVGQMLDLEHGMRGLAIAKEKAAYAKAMAKRTRSAQLRLQKIAETVESSELTGIVETAGSVKLKLNNEDELLAAAESISTYAKQFAANHDGKQFAGVDSFLPSADKYKKN
ncbi:MAG: hypothetical protein GKR93_10885 [Gammaproteobacteria bacterium]|nr:hypothetical protein [Gammaproteobacteria bacterium]